ncbi:MAG: hypothetical protein QF567_01810 [Candidatus Pacearchaeota archaeon]|jgi:hypothetical protein|nr:hypothetical protein [Candidatus Pacearchaeota archaeon]|tara:strand:- start:645 stop:809 length:165 start_codon:yes stop_codon:yes gene_type:complete
MKEEDISLLNQMIKTLKEAELKLEEFYNKKDYENFRRSKELILQIHEKISEVLK